ncbi:MAG: hypothetical protein K9L17_03545 [Clostridiales bacterium]|nr:hypothetical protein [Clostridiales bacterium]MCF8021753.1 hypothetical protein [Clostridiales bacterium]
MKKTSSKYNYWQSALQQNVPRSLIQYIDKHYHEQWNKDLAAFIMHKFGISITTEQLRYYASKHGLVKNIDEEQKARLLIKRYNIDVDDTVINNAISFIKDNSQHLSNNKLIKILCKDYNITITPGQLSRKINHWFAIKKTRSALAQGHKHTIAALKESYKAKHNEFLKVFSNYPQAETVILTSLLGDAELSPVIRGYNVFRDHHSSEQYEWLKFKTGFLPSAPYFTIKKYADSSFSIVSQSNPFFSELEQHFYKQSSREYKKMDGRKNREKYLDQTALQMCEEIFMEYPYLALSILIGDDGSLVASYKKNNVYFSYVIYCQGFAEEIGLELKKIIEKSTGVELSCTNVSSEYGIRLKTNKLKDTLQINKMIFPYLSKIGTDNFKKKYDFNWHIKRLSQKLNKNLSMGQPKNYWTTPELNIVYEGIKNKKEPATIYKLLLAAGFKRTYYATYYKYKELLFIDSK